MSVFLWIGDSSRPISISCDKLRQCAGAHFVDILNQVISDPDQWDNKHIGIFNVQ